MKGQTVEYFFENQIHPDQEKFMLSRPAIIFDYDKKTGLARFLVFSLDDGLCSRLDFSREPKIAVVNDAPRGRGNGQWQEVDKKGFLGL